MYLGIGGCIYSDYIIYVYIYTYARYVCAWHIYIRMCRTYASTNDRAYNVHTFKKILMSPMTIYAYIFKGIHLHEQTYECVYIHICRNEYI